MRQQQYVAGIPALAAIEEEEEEEEEAERERARRQLNTQPTKPTTHRAASGRICTTPQLELLKSVRSKIANSWAADELPPIASPVVPEARMDWNVMWAIVINVLMTVSEIQKRILNRLSPV